MSDLLSLARLRVLVLEDEVLVAMLYESALEGFGCLVTVSGSVDEALDLVRTNSFDCAFLDLRLGQRRVDPVARLLCARNIPFAFCSGYSRAELPPEHSERPVLPKPFAEAALAAMTRQLADEGRAPRRAACGACAQQA